MQTIKTEVQSPSSRQPAIPRRDPLCMGFVDRLLTASRLRLAWFYLVGTWRIYSSAIPSFRGHIQLQSPTEYSR